MPKTKQWGGRRKGAGRKRRVIRKVRVQLTLLPVTIERLEQINANRSAAVDWLAEWWAQQEKGEK